jgi:hypothetical protein
MSLINGTIAEEPKKGRILGVLGYYFWDYRHFEILFVPLLFLKQNFISFIDWVEP